MKDTVMVEEFYKILKVLHKRAQISKVDDELKIELDEE